MGPHGHWPRGPSGPPGRNVKPLFENDMADSGDGGGQMWDENSEVQEMWNNAAFDSSSNEHFVPPEQGGNANFSGGDGIGGPRGGRGGGSLKRDWQGDEDDDGTDWSNPASKVPRQEEGMAGGRGRGQGSTRGRPAGRGRRGGIM